MASYIHFVFSAASRSEPERNPSKSSVTCAKPSARNSRVISALFSSTSANFSGGTSRRAIKKRELADHFVRVDPADLDVTGILALSNGDRTLFDEVESLRLIVLAKDELTRAEVL